MLDFNEFRLGKRPIRIDPNESFKTNLDLSKLVEKDGATFICSECEKELVRIEPGGILGEGLNQLDAAVIFDHYRAKHWSG